MENEILAQILSELKNLNMRQESMEQQLIAFQQFTLKKFERIEQRFERIEQRFDGLEFSLKKTNLMIENEIRPSIQALADNQSQMQVQLDRIEEKVTTHDELIFKRVK